MRRLLPSPLGAAGFAPYGEVARRTAPAPANEGFGVRRDCVFAFSGAGGELCLSAFDVAARPAPIVIAALECHPFSAQAFYPVGDARALVVVALPDGRDAIDEDTLAAFVTERGDGFVYRPGVWHAPLTSFGPPASFVSAQWNGTAADCVVKDLSSPIRIDLEAIRA